MLRSTRLTREAINLIMGFDLAHIGINMPDADSSLSVTKKFSQIFNFTLKEGNNSNFAGTGIEVNKSIGLGKNGHIAIKTNSIPRAIAYLERNGFQSRYGYCQRTSRRTNGCRLYERRNRRICSSPATKIILQ